MSLDDYAHWNEEASMVWWQEEGRHETMHGLGDFDSGDPDDYDPGPEPDECRSIEDCVRTSCFSLPSATRIWECDICGRQVPEGLPLNEPVEVI